MEDPAKAPHHPPDIIHDVHDVHVVDHNGRQISGGSWVCCMPCYWLRTNNSVHKASLTLVTLLVTSLLVASPVLFLISSVPANEQPYKECTTIEEEDCFVERNLDAPLSTCDSSECKDLARRMQFSISWNIDPCRDFYKFACGGWPESYRLKSQRLRPPLGMDLSFVTIQTTVQADIQRLLSLNATSGRFKKLGLFYTSCLMSFSKPIDMSPMYMIIDKLGGYLPDSSLGPKDITSLIVNILKANGAPLFDIYLDRDVNNKSVYAIIIDLPRDALNHRSFYGGNMFEPQPFHRRQYKDYLNAARRRRKRDVKKENDYFKLLKEKHVERKIFALEGVINGMLPKAMKENEKAIEIENILQFASAADALRPSRKVLKEHLHDIENSKPISLENLQETFPFLTWKNLLRELLSDGEIGKRNIYVISRHYLQSINDLMVRTKTRIIQNALLAMFARDFLYIMVNNTAATDDKFLFCTHITTKAFSQAVSALYLTQYTKQYLDDLHDKAVDMFVQLKHALFSRVEKVSWLDAETKWRAMDKLAAMTAHFIAWPSLRNHTFVDDLINSLNITDDFFENIVIRYHEIKVMQMKVKDSDIINLSWPYPFVVNAFYETDDNSIVVPLALLTQPHFARSTPEYITYGTIGNVLAHEMLHALDYSAIPHTPSPLWAKAASLPALRSRLTCLANQYQAAFKRDFRVRGHDIHVEFDGNATLEENAADIGGIRVAWVAWRRIISSTGGKSPFPVLPLTPAKLFYLAMAQLYCTHLSPEDYVLAVENDFHMTAPERVNGLVRNSVAFAEVFHCPAGTLMNPANKCIIW